MIFSIKDLTMTLYQIVSILKQIALNQPNVQSATDGSVYDVMNATNSVKYDVVHFSQTKHISDEENDYYGFNIFYISRLEDSLEDNRLQIQSIGKELLDNILRTFCENWGIEFPEIIYYPFTQKFADLCAGVYCKVELQIAKELLCADDYTAEVVPGSGIKLQDMGITITQNGLIVITPGAEYDGIGEIRIETDVPQYPANLEYKEVEYTDNGEYVVRPGAEYDGLSEVAISVDVDDRYDEGYDAGEAAGEQEQKSKLASTSFTENNSYVRENGWSSVTVNVDDRYDEGYAEGKDDGVDEQKAKLTVTSFTENDTYTNADGWSAVTVDVPQYTGGTYEEGYEDGEAAQKAKLASTSFTQNSAYTRADGWSSVTVDVDDRYDEGYADGYADGFAAGASACSGMFITAITLNVPSAITDSGTATTSYSPNTGITDIYYTSSDPNKATIDPDTGVITVVSDGNVTICTNDRFSGLRDCETISVALSPIVATAITIVVPSAITDSATATTVVSPSGASTDITYSSSDTDVATIDPDTGVITVITSGTVTFCAYDSISQLQDCETVTVALSPPAATSITINVPSTIYVSATATTTVSPSGATTNITYSSSDTTKATIDPNTGVISVIGDGTVTFCAYDSINQLQDCKTVSVFQSYGELEVVYYVTSLNYPTKILEEYGRARLYFDYFTYDGVNYEIGSGTTGFTFPTLGRHTVRYHITNPEIGPAFWGCENLVEAHIPPGVSRLAATFVSTSLSAVTFNEGLVSIENAFRETKLINVVLPDSLQTIGEDSFDECFSLTSVTVGNNVCFIGDYAFYKCTSLTGLTFPASLGSTPQPASRIYGWAFCGCTSLSHLTFLSETPAMLVESNHFVDTNNCPIYVPCQSVSEYRSSWGNSNRITCNPPTIVASSITLDIPSSITDSATAKTAIAPSGATTNITYGSSDTTKATIDQLTGGIIINNSGTVTFCAYDSVSQLQDCKTVSVSVSPIVSAVTAITLSVPNTIVGIGQATVSVEPAKARVDIRYSSSDETIATIDELGTITAVSDGVVTIYATENNTHITDSKVVNIVTSINYNEYLTVVYSAATTEPIKIIEEQYGYDTIDYFLYNGVQYNLTSGFSTFAFPTTGRQVCAYHLRSATTVGANAFSGCNNILEVRVPSGVTTVGNSCFNGCSSMSSATMPSEIQSIGELSFANCDGLKYMLLRATTPPSIYVGESNSTFLNTRCELYIPNGAGHNYVYNSNFYNYRNWLVGFDPKYITGTTKIVEAVYTSSAVNEYIRLWRGDLYFPKNTTSTNTGWTEMYEFKDSIRAIEIDGVFVPADCYYRFASSGRHTVKIYITTERLPRECFGQSYNTPTDVLSEIKIGKGILRLDSVMVARAPNLTGITVENTVGKVGLNSLGSFNQCNIKEMIFFGTEIPSNGPSVTYNETNIEKISVPAVALDDYKMFWPKYANIITAIEN